MCHQNTKYLYDIIDNPCLLSKYWVLFILLVLTKYFGQKLDKIWVNFMSKMKYVPKYFTTMFPIRHRAFSAVISLWRTLQLDPSQILTCFFAVVCWLGLLNNERMMRRRRQYTWVTQFSNQRFISLLILIGFQHLFRGLCTL